MSDFSVSVQAPPSTVDELLARLKEDKIEYLRVESVDIHGRWFGKMMPVPQFKAVTESGVSWFVGTWFFTSGNGLIHDFFPNYKYCNVYNFPIPSTYQVLSYLAPSARVARVLTYPQLPNNPRFEGMLFDRMEPRSLLQRQIARLRSEFGLVIKSAFEHEFQVLRPVQNSSSAPSAPSESSGTDSKVLKNYDAIIRQWEPLWYGKFFLHAGRMFDPKFSQFVLDCERCLRGMGVDLEALSTEYSPGQFEWSMTPTFGVQAADCSSSFRNGIKEIATQHGFKATFACIPYPNDIDGAANGAHYNFSLWFANDSVDAASASDAADAADAAESKSDANKESKSRKGSKTVKLSKAAKTSKSGKNKGQKSEKAADKKNDAEETKVSAAAAKTLKTKAVLKNAFVADAVETEATEATEATEDAADGAEAGKDANTDEARDGNEEKSGENANEKRLYSKISDLCLHFMGGMFEHIDSLTVFSNANVNGFRRTRNHAWAPGNCTWALNNRTCCVRVKNMDSSNGTYLEFRMPCSASNPYLVMTSVLAAGMDGIRRKLDPGAPCETDAFDESVKGKYKMLADTLDVAMEALQKDEVMKDAFCEEFIQWYVNCKKLEIQELEAKVKQFGDQGDAETLMFLDL